MQCCSACNLLIKTPLYIVGPCSAESRDQVMETARAIKAQSSVPFIFRAGVWKPRTSPSSFQGAGEEALAWLKEVKDTFGVSVATEVATPEHVSLALNAGIDYLWIGARTSANPIAVQSLAEAIDRFAQREKTADAQRKKQPKALLIKNPVNADAALWIGNIERLEKTGVPVMAIHRGCNHQPCWMMAHAVRSARPDIPMLLDPSHLSGDAAKVPELMTKVSELGLDGAMIEVHAHPESALSDKKQQIKPEALESLISFEGLTSLTTSNNLKQPQTSNETELAWLRAEIDELDEQLWETIAARMDVSKRIGAWKKAHGVAPLQPERYQMIGERLKVKGERLGLPEEFIKRVWDSIHEQSLKQQQ